MIGALRQRVEESFRSFGRVFGNPDIRKIELAWSGWVLGHWAYGIALAVYAYEQGGAPAVGLVGWELTLVQQFQFGDLRVETPRATVVVELESAGGVGNLVKYWPLLAGGELPKRLLLIHVFQIGSAGDYIAHRRLWGFVVERMREDLERRGVSYPDPWEARLFTYRKGEEAVEAAAFLREAVAGPDDSRVGHPSALAPRSGSTRSTFR